MSLAIGGGRLCEKDKAYGLQKELAILRPDHRFLLHGVYRSERIAS